MANWKLKIEIDKAIDALIPVIVKGDKDLETKIAGLGTRVGAFTGWGNRPTVDALGSALSLNDTFRLEVADGAHPAGLYARKADNSDWEDTPFLNFDSIGISQIIADAKAGSGDMVVDGSTGAVTATVDDKFTTPLQVKDALETFRGALTGLYHPKGGDANLKVVGKDADEGTQEFITANQASVVYTTSEVQSKYDAL